MDGASRGNPGPASVGVVFQDADGNVTGTISKTIGVTTNNTAEYTALLFALQEALMRGLSELEVYTDSELVVKQLAGEYKMKEESLKNLFQLVLHLKQGFKKISVRHVPRERNKLADREANKALDQASFL